MSEEQPTRAELEDMSIGDLHAWVEAAQNAQEAANRLHSDGRNELRETKRIQPWRIFARQFSGLLVAILFGASLISAIFGDWLDCLAIVAIMVGAGHVFIAVQL